MPCLLLLTTTLTGVHREVCGQADGEEIGGDVLRARSKGKPTLANSAATDPIFALQDGDGGDGDGRGGEETVQDACASPPQEYLVGRLGFFVVRPEVVTEKR